MNARKYLKYFIPVLLVIFIKLFSLFPSAVEQYYSNGIYPVVSRLQRILLGWLPFSIGDLVYGSFAIYLFILVYRFIRAVVKRKLNRQSLLKATRKTLLFASWIYILFNVFWGLNYNRLGIGFQMDLRPARYTRKELEILLDMVIARLNSAGEAPFQDRPAFKSKKYLFSKAAEAYSRTTTEYPFLDYATSSVKPSLFSYLGNYLGFTGYYNPFTGEAQVNTTVPVYIQPYTTTHELGHQLGYAREMEANFAGYLAASHSPDPAVQYSVYFDLYVYAIRNLYEMDSTAAIGYARRLPPGAKRDIQELKRFSLKYENPFEPIIRKLYGQYLRANEQPQGMLSYDEVLAWVIAYHRKYQRI